MPRVTTQKLAAHNKRAGDIVCGKCGDAIIPGEQYRKWKFRYGGPRYRCMKAACSPRASDLTQGRIGEVYQLQESLEDQVRDAGDLEELAGILDSTADEAEGLAGEFEDGLNNMPDGLRDGDTGQMIQERVDALNDWAGELRDKASEARDRASEIEDAEEAWATYREHLTMHEDALAEWDEANGDVPDGGAVDVWVAQAGLDERPASRDALEAAGPPEPDEPDPTDDDPLEEFSGDLLELNL